MDIYLSMTVIKIPKNPINFSCKNVNTLRATKKILIKFIDTETPPTIVYHHLWKGGEWGNPERSPPSGLSSGRAVSGQAYLPYLLLYRALNSIAFVISSW